MTIELATKKSKSCFTYDLIGSNYMMVYAMGNINITTKEPIEAMPGVFGFEVVASIETPELSYEEFVERARTSLIEMIATNGGINPAELN